MAQILEQANIVLNKQTVKVNYNSLITDDVILVDATTGQVTVTLPPPASVFPINTPFEIKKIDASANAVIVASASNIDGVPSYAISAQYDSITVFSDGTTYWILTKPGSGGGGGGVTTITNFGSTPNNAGGTISGTSLTLQPADGTHPGGVSTAAQSFGGDKTFAGNISAANLSGTNTGDQTNITGNAGTATALQTARTINGVAFDGTANITIPSGAAAAGTLTGTTLAANVVNSSLTSVGTLATLTVTATITGSVSGNAGTATALQTARTINGVAFDGTANITIPSGAAAAGTLTGTTLAANVVNSSLTSVGTLTSLTVSGAISASNFSGSSSGTNTGDQTNITGNAGTATALQTPRTINGVSFDGTANITVAAAAGTLTGTTLANNVVTSSLTSVGTLASLTVTAPITGSVSGNAGTATALQTARTINGVSFDGTANITVPAAAGTLTGTTLASNVVTSSLTSVGTLATLTVTAAIVGSITGNAATATALATARAIYGNNFDGTAALSQIIAATYGGTGNAFTQFSGPAGSIKTFTLPNANSDLGYLEVPANSQSTNYTAVLADSGYSIDHPSTDANARTFTIPANASVAYPVGTCLSFSNMTSQAVTIAITSDTMYLAGTGTTGSRSLAQYGTATARKLTSTTWLISGIGLT